MGAMSVAVDTPPPSGSDAGLGRDVWIVASVVIVGAVMSILDTTIVNVALDVLSRELDAPLATIQWVSTGYLLALAIVIPLSGWMSERFGSKPVWMVSVGLFGLGSALCGVSWSPGSLIFFRVLQGLGGGMIMPVGMSLLAQTAGPQRVGRVMSVIGVPMLLGPILGPVIGGLIVDSTSWRWIFFVNVPISLAALPLAARLLPRDTGRTDAGRLDWIGLALLSPGIAGIVFGLSETESHGGIGHPIAFGPILAGVLLVALFVVHGLRVSRPLIDLTLFRSPRFRAAAATIFLVGGALFGAMLVLPLLYQLGRGDSALTAGLLMAPQGLGAAIAMPLTGRLTDRIGGGQVALAGLAVMTLATLPFVWMGVGTSSTLLAAALFVRGLGLGGVMMPSMAAAYAVLAPAAVPRATSALNVLQRIGGSIGVALLAVVLQHEMRVAGAPADAAGPLNTAFGHTFAWAACLTLLAMVPAALLARAERAERRAGQPRRDAPFAPRWRHSNRFREETR
jgi:EmrB/QacA subfamily drug resistance transporter